MITEMELYAIAKTFRKASEIVAKRENKKDYPRAWCGVISRSLGSWLCYRYPEEVFFYICGKRNGGYSHAWIQYKNFFIDITADQFDDCNESIMVIEKELSKFHKTFKIDFNNTYEFNIKDINDIIDEPG